MRSICLHSQRKGGRSGGRRHAVVSWRRALPLLVGLLAGRAASSALPQDCDWNYRVQLPPNGPTASRWPVLGDEDDPAGLTLFLGANAPLPSDLLFTDGASNRARAPFFRITDSTLALDAPLQALDEQGRTLVLVMLQSRVEANRLLVFRRDSSGTGADHGFRPLPVAGADSSAARFVEPAPEPPDLYLRETSLSVAGDLLPDHPGVEVLYEHVWHCRDARGARHWIELRSVEDWRLHWSVELPGSVRDLLVEPGVDGPGFVLLTGNGCHGSSALGLDDCQPWLLRFDRFGRQIGEAFDAAPEGPGIAAHVHQLPGDPGRLLLQNCPDWRPDSSASRLRLLDAGSFEVLAEAPVPFSVSSLVRPALDGSWQLLLQEDGPRISAWNSRLEPAGVFAPEEACSLLGWLPAPAGGPGRAGEALALVSTASGRLVVLDEALRILSADPVAGGDFKIRRGPRPQQDSALPVYRAGEKRLLALNTSVGPLHGDWIRRDRRLLWALRAAIGLLSVALGLGALRLYRRWRLNRIALQALYRASPDAVLLADRRLRLVEMNGPMAKLIADVAGADAEPTRPGRPLAELLSQGALQRLLEVLEAGRPVQERWSCLIDSSPEDWWLRLQPLDAGRADRMLVLRNISHQLGEDRRRVWRSMSQTTAHHMKTPLQGLSGSIDSILHRLHRKAGSGLDDGDVDLVRAQALEAGARSRELKGLIHDFLSISDREIRPRPLDLKSFLLKEVGRFKEQHARLETRIRLRLADDLTERVAVDAFHLLHALVNLLENALKAVAGAGEIVVEAGGLDGGGFWIEVHDDGRGIEPAALPRIFEPQVGFFGEGTGLGLAIVKHVVDAHGGRIRVRSRLGEGTSMRLEFPAEGRMA